MKQSWKMVRRGSAVLGMLLGGWLLTGCHTHEPVYAALPGTPAAPRNTDVFQIGDVVSVTFTAGGAETPLPAHTEAIKDDGTITPPFSDLLGGSIKAAGKAPGQLQKELQERYNKLYRNITVTVNSAVRSYYVYGEVRGPGPKAYPGEMDVIKAISSAGDFTDFANKKRIQITHANGQKETVNFFKILADPQKDKPIFPGDKIYVPRRWF